MKNLIISFLVCFGLIVYFSFPAFMDRPLDLTLRIMIYLAYPAAVILGMVFIIVGHYFGLFKMKEVPSEVGNLAEVGGEMKHSKSA